MDLPAPVSPSGWAVVELPGETMVTVTGDIDIAVTAEFRRCLEAAARPGTALLIDLTAVTFLDGPGYGAIRAAAASLSGLPPRVTVATRSALVAAILQATAGHLLRIQAAT